MAGHSAWKNIKHRKAAVDAKRGKIWSKCSRAIIVAARNGGGDPKFNTTLRYAIDDAKAANMPKDTIEKAVKKGTGDLEGQRFETVRYEAYAPGGVADYVARYQQIYERISPDQWRRVDWAGPVLERYVAHGQARLRAGANMTDCMKDVVAAALVSPQFLYLYDDDGNLYAYR